MAGKNRITSISNLTSLRKLDVLDLHSNDIKVTDGLEGLNDLRVLNLAGNIRSRVVIILNVIV
jgi:Leucine-rich repeat (LRR) protein